MALYIGVNYHPHDWEKERWREDIRLMKEAGFQMVRLGHLCWDSYEPEEGVYTFDWFDQVMDLFAEAGIRVFLDVSVRPAPVWVHRLCMGCNIAGKSGMVQGSVRRYMEDVLDPSYQYYALRFAKILAERYGKHPALFAFGLCNEIGDGYCSYSEYGRRRFAQWLKKKYGTVEALNEAWAARRWSRKLESFDDVVFPENEVAVGSPESRLDMRRFWGDGIGEFLVKLKKTVEEGAPGVAHSSNHYGEKENLGFDYLKVCRDFVDYPGIGFYPGYEVGEKFQYLYSVYMQRLGEMGKPMWCLEFQAGSKGVFAGPKGAVRMQALLCLMHRGQMILGWTWRSMLGGEEQYLYGLLTHDGVPGPVYEEYKQLAGDMRKLEKCGFPYLPKPDIGVAYNYDSSYVTYYADHQFRQAYGKAVEAVTEMLFWKNRDFNIVDLRKLEGTYKVLFVPGHVVMEPQAADTIRAYVRNGGVVVMTAQSATVDETGKVFAMPRPGRLTDVFGIRVSGFCRTDQPWLWKEGARLAQDNGKKRELLTVRTKGQACIRIDTDCYERLEVREASVWADFSDYGIPAVTVNEYGRGKAYYVAAEPEEGLLGLLFDELTDILALERGPEVPEGIQARRLCPGQVFYVNTGKNPVAIPLQAPGKGVLGGKLWEKELRLDGYDGELIVEENYKIP